MPGGILLLAAAPSDPVILAAAAIRLGLAQTVLSLGGMGGSRRPVACGIW